MPGAESLVSSPSDEPHTVVPLVNYNKCEAKGMCTHVCSRQVFRISKISDEQFAGLSFFGKLRSIFSENRKSIVVHPELCNRCGLCVNYCPTKAIRLVKTIQ